MDKEVMEQLQLILEKVGDLPTKTEMQEEIRQAETRTKVFVENTVMKKIEALFDGYKLTHEKQWELERRIDHLEEIVEDLRTRIA